MKVSFEYIHNENIDNQRYKKDSRVLSDIFGAILEYSSTIRILDRDSLDTPDIVVILGGDGSVLKGVHRYLDRGDTPIFTAINTGTLGFFSDWTSSQAKEFVYLIDNLEIGKIPTKQYSLIETTLYDKEENILNLLYSLNEVTLKTTNTTFISEVYIDGNHFENFRGDGLCISTPMGSTAYNKSLGGALVMPTLKTMQLTEIASINNIKFRTISSSILMDSSTTLTLYPNQNEDYFLYSDAKKTRLQGVFKVESKISMDKQVEFLDITGVSFWEKVKTSFIGG